MAISKEEKREMLKRARKLMRAEKTKVIFDETKEVAKSVAVEAVGKVVLGTAKTVKESSFSQKLLIGSLVGNAIAKALDLDLPFEGLGIDSNVDAFVDNASDVAGVIGLGLLGRNLTKNIAEVNPDEIWKSIKESADEIDDDDAEDLD